MKAFSLVALVVALTLVLAGARVAEARVVAQGQAIGGPAFAGDAVVFATPGADGRLELRKVAASGEVTVVARFREAPEPSDPWDDGFGFYSVVDADVAGSDQAIAATAWRYAYQPLVDDPPGTPLAVPNCRADVLDRSLRVRRVKRVRTSSVRLVCPTGCRGAVRVDQWQKGRFRAVSYPVAFVAGAGERLTIPVGLDDYRLRASSRGRVVVRLFKAGGSWRTTTQSRRVTLRR